MEWLDSSGSMYFCVRISGRKCQSANKWLDVVGCLENTGNLPCSKSFFLLFKCWKAPGSHSWTNCSRLQINEGQFERSSCVPYSIGTKQRSLSIHLPLFSFKGGRRDLWNISTSKNEGLRHQLGQSPSQTGVNPPPQPLRVPRGKQSLWELGEEGIFYKQGILPRRWKHYWAKIHLAIY